MENEKTRPVQAVGRRSERAKKRKESYSPEMKSERKVLKTNTKTKLPSRTNPNRLFDLMPNGEPFCCHLCKSPYVACPVNKAGKKKERSRHAPLPNTRIDQNTGREMVLCNACAQTYDHPRVRVKKPVSVPTEEEQETYITEATLFTKTLRQNYDDSRVEKLFCPVSKKKLCGCLQKYIKIKGTTGEDSPVHKLLCLMKEAETLRREKVYSVSTTNSTKPKKFIGLGNGHKKSKRYEAFVLEKRQYLKDTMQLCERAIQRILIYSNNFLHKRLKTENRPCRIERTRGKAVLGTLPDLMSLVDLVCCYKNCVAMAWTHRKLLQEWRERAQQGQMEARRVLAEMLTPTGASNCNCYAFISMVTGCSLTTIGRVFNQMLDTNGDREPPEHGMKRVWQENYMKNKVTTVDTNSTQAIPNQSPREEVASEQASIKQSSSAVSHYQQEHEKLALIQQELSQKQQQLQQQQVNLHLLAQQVSTSSNWQNPALVQQLFKQLASQSNTVSCTSDDTLTVPQTIVSKGAYFQPQNKYGLVRTAHGFQISQEKSVQIINSPSSEWTRSSQQGQDTAHIIDNQSTGQLQPVIRPFQPIIVNQSSFPTLLNQPMPLNTVQMTMSTNEPQIPQPLIQQQLPNLSQESGNTLIADISQLGQILSSDQINQHKPHLNMPVMNNQSQILPLIQHNDTGNPNIEQTHSSGFICVQRQPSDTQPMQVQMIQNQNLAENQSTVSMVDNSHVKSQVEDCRPIMIPPEVMQQMLHNGTIQILPQVEAVSNTRLNQTSQGNKAETSELPKHQQANTHTSSNVSQPQIISHDQSLVSTEFESESLRNNQFPQLMQMFKIPCSSEAQTLKPIAYVIGDSDCLSNSYNQMNLSNTEAVVPSESNYQVSAVPTVATQPITEASTHGLSIAGEAYMTNDRPIEYRPILPEEAQYHSREDDVQGQLPSQIQISFETVIDETGQTATKHIVLPHSNVLTLPIVPVFTVPTIQPDASQPDQSVEPTSVSSLTKGHTEMSSDLQQRDTGNQIIVKGRKIKAKTKCIKTKAEMLAEKEIQVDKLLHKNNEISSESKHRKTGPKRKVKKENKHILGRDNDLNKNMKRTNVCETVEDQTMRQEDEGSTDKSRHSSGNSIRSRQSSGNSECLKQTLLLDSLRPLSGMSDILERSRQHSGNSQFTMRSRTSSGNSFLTEQLHGTLLSNLSPNAFMNKERGLFFLSSENELGEISSIPISDTVNPVADFILSDETITDLPNQVEIEGLPERQIQSNSQITSLHCSSKDIDENSQNALNKTSVQMKLEDRVVLKPSPQQQLNISDTGEHTRKPNSNRLKTLVDKTPVLNSLLLKPPKHRPWTANNKVFNKE